MTEVQFELALLIIKGIVKLAERLDTVGKMTDDECRAAMPVVQVGIDANDKVIMEL